ncbi:hypothetical protein PTKIN_Ptkin03bG0166700 [Pterospermum kingtungense]
MDPSPRKSNKIRDIVRLQQILKKWRKLANTSKSTNNSSNSNSNNGSKSIKFLKRTLSLSSDTSAREAPSRSVPKGYLAVSVGEEQKRYVIPTEYLSHQAFHILLRQAEEEFGFQQTGVLRIPCQVSIFETILKMVEENKDFFFVRESMGYCSSESQRTPSHHPQKPMCR